MQVLPVFPACRKISTDIIMHVRLVRIPTPAAISQDRDIPERIEPKPLKSFMPGSRSAVANVSVPKMQDIPFDECSVSLEVIANGLGPGAISLPLRLIHKMIGHDLVK